MNRLNRLRTIGLIVSTIGMLYEMYMIDKYWNIKTEFWFSFHISLLVIQLVCFVFFLSNYLINIKQ